MLKKVTNKGPLSKPGKRFCYKKSCNIIETQPESEREVYTIKTLFLIVTWKRANPLENVAKSERIIKKVYAKTHFSVHEKFIFRCWKYLLIRRMNEKLFCHRCSTKHILIRLLAPEKKFLAFSVATWAFIV